jgi:hypothetical protein
VVMRVMEFAFVHYFSRNLAVHGASLCVSFERHNAVVQDDRQSARRDTAPVLEAD